MSRWDDLHQEERALAFQLEDLSDERRRVEKLFAKLEGYDHHSWEVDNKVWDAAHQSKYAWQLEVTSNQLRQQREKTRDDFADCITALKKDERKLEDRIDAIYYEKLRETRREEEERDGH